MCATLGPPLCGSDVVDAGQGGAQARRYITDSLGGKYAEGVNLDMEAMCAESDKRTPLVCFLSMGSDPTENIERLAKSKVCASRARAYTHTHTLTFPQMK